MHQEDMHKRHAGKLSDTTEGLKKSSLIFIQSFYYTLLLFIIGDSIVIHSCGKSLASASAFLQGEKNH
jgi:hypothetical protein